MRALANDPRAQPATVQGGTNVVKSARLYVLLLAVWAMLLVGAAGPAWAEIGRSRAAAPWVTAVIVLDFVFVAYFWLNGVKDLIYVLHYYATRRSLRRATAVPARTSPRCPRVVMLYCVADDFNSHSLERSRAQNYANVSTVILDDSKRPESRAEIDRYAQDHGLQVVRRPDRAGFKAGNLNNYLRGRVDYDYFVILDSDEIIPRTFITRALDYMAHYSNAGIVQANHIATRNRTRFMTTFARGVDSHWPVYQLTKHRHGFLSLLGHGALISRDCYQAAGGFPHLVAEDLCFSIEARDRGFFVVFAEDIVCEEEYPIDYLAFKKRHSKWTQGNMEFITSYTARIARSRMSWFEKLDIVLFTYNLPLTAVFAIYVVINVVALPLAGYHTHLAPWLLVPTLLFLLAPALNDIIYWAARVPIWVLGAYVLLSFSLYGSMFFVSLYASLRGMLGAKASFIVTPKTSETVTWTGAIWHNRRELAFAATLLALSLFTTGSVLAVALIALPSISSVYLTMMTRRPLRGTAAPIPG